MAGSELIFQAHHHCVVIVAIITQLHAHITPDAGRRIQIAIYAMFNFPQITRPGLFNFHTVYLDSKIFTVMDPVHFNKRFKVVTVRTAVFLLSTNKGVETKSGLDIVICVILNT